MCSLNTFVFVFQLDMTHIQSEFLRCDITENGECHFVFASASQLSYLAKSELWFMDGTFHVVCESFQQLPSLHSFIKSGDAMKQVPLCFVLMSQ